MNAKFFYSYIVFQVLMIFFTGTMAFTSDAVGFAASWGFVCGVCFVNLFEIIFDRKSYLS